MTRLLDAVGGTDPAARRDRALLELLYGTGTRISEVVGLDLADLAEVADGGGLLRVYGKGSKERLVPLGGQAAAGPGRLAVPGGPGRHACPGSGGAGATPRPSS